ncbi:MAG: small multi-drug export protein [Sphingobacterium sp.]|nr:small multi-drug export protein [Sphingobacterium sp.]
MELSTLLTTVFLSFLPISELRGAIPYAVARGVPLPAAFVLAVACNVLVAPFAFLFLGTLHGLLHRWGFYARLFDRIVGEGAGQGRQDRRKVRILGASGVRGHPPSRHGSLDRRLGRLGPGPASTESHPLHRPGRPGRGHRGLRGRRSRESAPCPS